MSIVSRTAPRLPRRIQRSSVAREHLIGKHLQASVSETSDSSSNSCVSKMIFEAIFTSRKFVALLDTHTANDSEISEGGGPECPIKNDKDRRG
jgi:hypothetical protein